MTTLKPARRTLINDSIARAGLDGNGRFEKVGAAFSAAVEVMRRHGVEIAETVSLLETDQGRCTVRIAMSNPADAFSPTEIKNSVLSLQWTRLDARFEVVGYLS